MIAGLNSDLFTLVTQDADIQTIFQGSGPEAVRYFLQWADRGALFPYLVQVQRLAPDPDCWGVYVGTWIVDVWDNYPDASRTIALRNRIVAMFQRRTIAIGDDYKDARFWLEGDMPVPENSDRIWRHTIVFGVRVTATGDIAAVLEREGE